MCSRRFILQIAAIPGMKQSDISIFPSMSIFMFIPKCERPRVPAKRKAIAPKEKRVLASVLWGMLMATV